MIFRLESHELAASPLAFDRACRVARNWGDTIIIGEGGQAATRGTWDFPEHGWMTLGLGVGLILEDGAALRLSPDAVRKTGGVERPAKDLNLLWAAGNNRVLNGTYDGCEKDHPGWCVGGLRFYGRRIHEDCVIRGLSGYRNKAESFAISAQGATGGSITRRIRVEDCNVVDGQTYVSGIYEGATVDNGLTSIVEDCHVDLGVHGQFAYSSSFRTRFSRCHGTAMRYWYTDTGPGVAEIIDGSGEASYSVFGSVAILPSEIRDIRVSGGEFQAPEGRLIELWDKGGSHVGGISLERVKASAKWRAAVAGSTGRITVLDCTLACGPDALSAGSIKPQEIAPIP